MKIILGILIGIILFNGHAIRYKAPEKHGYWINEIISKPEDYHTWEVIDTNGNKYLMDNATHTIRFIENY